MGGPSVICKNCGFHNEPGDEFCGSCGQFLEFTGVVAEPEAEPADAAGSAVGQTGGATDAEPIATDQGAGSGATPADEPAERPGGTEAAGGAGGAGAAKAAPPRKPDVICWNCKTRNKAGRTFCLKCGERLTVGGGSSRGRVAAILVGVAALVLLAVGAAAVFLGGGPAPTATPTLAPPSPTPTRGVSPSASATSTAQAAITPTPTRSCSSSAEPVRTVELNRANPERRSGQQTAWCIRDVTFVARRGEGVLRLLLINPRVFTDAPDGTYEWLVARMPADFGENAEYHPPIAFPPPFDHVPAGTTIRLVIECTSDNCNGRAHIAYDRIAAP